MATKIRMRPFARIAVLVTLPLCGCGSVLTEGTSDAAGIAGAGIAGAVTKNATVGAAIGLGVQSVARFGLQYTERRVHRTEQDRIAAAAGALPDGGAGVWSVSHTVAIEPDRHGELVVTRIFAARPDAGVVFTCKEIVFSVDPGKPGPVPPASVPPASVPSTAAQPSPTQVGAAQSRAFYTATVCLDGDRWKWASAEPAVERWGGLQ